MWRPPPAAVAAGGDRCGRSLSAVHAAPASETLQGDPRVTTFYLIRHGEHALLGRVLAGRMPGVPLSERGRAEAGWLAERLAEERIDALYASPIARTRETAAIIAERLRLPVICREDVIELDYGEWTGASFETVRGDPRWQLWSRCRSIATLPGGESMRAVQQRIVAALFDLYVRHPNGRVAIVSHGDVIRAALLFALGMPSTSMPASKWRPPQSARCAWRRPGSACSASTSALALAPTIPRPGVRPRAAATPETTADTEGSGGCEQEGEEGDARRRRASLFGPRRLRGHPPAGASPGGRGWRGRRPRRPGRRDRRRARSRRNWASTPRRQRTGGNRPARRARRDPRHGRARRRNKSRAPIGRAARRWRPAARSAA